MRLTGLLSHSVDLSVSGIVCYYASHRAFLTLHGSKCFWDCVLQSPHPVTIKQRSDSVRMKNLLQAYDSPFLPLPHRKVLPKRNGLGEAVKKATSPQ